MKKLISFALGAAAIVAAILSPAKASAQIFYKVEKPGDSHVSYILGTHHFAPVSMLDSIAGLNDALNNIDKLYGELDMEKMTDPSTIMSMQQFMMAPADSTLDKVLTPVQLDSVNTVWKDLTKGQMPLEMLYPMKPSALSTQIAALLATQVFPELVGMEGIDKTMQDRAKKLGKKIDGLETIEFQLNTLMGNPISEQAADLMEMIGDIDSEIENTRSLSEAYVAHDIVRMEKLMEDENDSPEDLERLIYGRNDNWAARLVKELPSESIMVVVGAGHLPGERGLLTQLRKAGFTVTPLDK